MAYANNISTGYYPTNVISSYNAPGIPSNSRLPRQSSQTTQTFRKSSSRIEAGNEYFMLRHQLVNYPEIKIPMVALIDYAAAFITEIFNCENHPIKTAKSNVSFPDFLNTLVRRTSISSITLATAYFYLYRLKQMHPRCKGSDGSGFRLFLSAIVLAAKYLYDDTFDNSSWATVSSDMFTLTEVNKMEREMLHFLDFSLFILSEEWVEFYEHLRMKIESYERAKANFGNSGRFESRSSYSRTHTTAWNEESQYQYNFNQ